MKPKEFSFDKDCSLDIIRGSSLISKMADPADGPIKSLIIMTFLTLSLQVEVDEPKLANSV